MANFATIAAAGVRSTVAWATAIALLLPLPARCASCSTGSEHCPRCMANVAESLRDSHNGARTCCQRRPATDSSPTASTINDSVHHGQHACGCGFRPIQRTMPSVEKLSLSPELNASLTPAATLPFALPANTATASDFTLAALPSPIPHRILHCSWII